MSAKQFIDQLEFQGLLSPEIVEELRHQVEESKARITPQTLARLLVDNGHLTKFQATKLIADLGKSAPTRSRSSTSSSNVGADDELDLAPMDPSDSGGAGGFNPNKATIIDDDDLVEVSEVDVAEVDSEVEVTEVEVLDDDQPIQAVEIEDRRRRRSEREAADENVEVVEVIEDSDESVPNRQSESIKPRRRITKLEKPAKSKRNAGGLPLPSSVNKPPASAATAKPGTNPWESHRILTIGTILAILMVAAATLVWHFMKGNAETILLQADESYKQRSYDAAIKKYDGFVEDFPAHAQMSFARVRSGLAQMRKDIEGLPDPSQALKTAEDVLPNMATETAMASERGDVAGALVQLAQKFNERADAAADTATKKTLMDDGDKVLAMIADAQYVGNSAREQNRIALKGVEEERNRILLDISRDEKLQAALVEMDAQLKENATAAAYDVRRTLIRTFPQLEKDPGVLARVQEAARIQQGLVVSTSPEIKTAPQPPPLPQTRTVVLANRIVTKEIPSMAGRVLCLRVKGTVYGLDGQNGMLKWRTFVGRDMTEEPLRLSDSPTSDVVVCRPELGHLSRLDGSTGSPKWFCELGGAALSPRSDAEDLLVAQAEGTLLNLDPENGQLKWAIRLPQALELTPLASPDKPHLYLTGDHSNLYVLSRQDGKCKEVFYLGHQPGTVVVPPMMLLGQLFVFENRTTDRASIRILQTNDAGVQLSVEQTPIDIEGNIVTQPLVDGRKLIVISDRGQIKVLDIEPSSEKNKVSVIASEVASESRPTITWGVTESNQLWMANYRFTRWDVQVSTGKLIRPWIKDDGDRFAGPPQKYGDIIVHQRVVRDTRGVRVAAVRADNGEALWTTDLGVPVALLASPAAGKFEAITTNTALFSIDPSQTLLNQTETSSETSKPAVLYDNPRYLSNGTITLNNLSTENRLANYSPTLPGNRLKIVTANFGGAVPTAPPAVVEANLAFGLDNGQLVVVDPSNGAFVATPFQPPVEPGRKHTWNQPAYNSQLRVLYATDNRKKLYRLAVSDSLKLMADIDVDGTVLGPLAVLGKQVALVLTNQTDESLVVFDGTSLARASKTPLVGRWQAGPFALGTDAVLVQTDRKLQAFGSDGAQLWAVDFPHVRLAGEPTVGSTGLVIAATNGQAWRIDQASGAILNTLQVDQPLSTVPLAVPGGMLLGTDEGTVLLMPLAEASAGAREPQ